MGKMRIVFILTVTVLACAVVLTLVPAKKNADSSISLITGMDDKEIKGDSTKVRIERWLKNSAAEAQEKWAKFLSSLSSSPKVSDASIEEMVKSRLENLKKTEKKYGKMIRKIAKEKDVPEKTAIALAAGESGGCSDAINNNDNGSIDRGLYQLNDHGVGAGFPEDTLFNPKKNTEIALSALADLIRKYGDTKTAIIAFQIGYGKLDSLIAKNQFDKNNYSKAELIIRLSEKIQP
jgi:soluble lytic murein transglycosylase-like protein